MALRQTIFEQRQLFYVLLLLFWKESSNLSQDGEIKKQFPSCPDAKLLSDAAAIPNP